MTAETKLIVLYCASLIGFLGGFALLIATMAFEEIRFRNKKEKP